MDSKIIDRCIICNIKHPNTTHFFWAHKLSAKDYCEQFVKKKDLYDGSLIPFKKDIESYFLKDFNDKINLKKYLDVSSREEGIKYMKGWLLKRKHYKDLIYAPSEFEVKSYQFPSIHYINTNFGAGTYENICEEIKLKVKYNYSKEPTFGEFGDFHYICDTREQNVLKFPNFEVQKLNYGDYTIKENTNIFIEKKSLQDAVATLTKGYNRFEMEIQRCQADGKYLIILITEKYANTLSFSYLPHMKYTSCSSEYLFHQARELMHKYPDTIQFLCVDGKEEAVRAINRIYRIQEDIRTIDLQYHYSREEL